MLHKWGNEAEKIKGLCGQTEPKAETKSSPCPLSQHTLLSWNIIFFMCFISAHAQEQLPAQTCPSLSMKQKVFQTFLQFYRNTLRISRRGRGSPSSCHDTEHVTVVPRVLHCTVTDLQPRTPPQGCSSCAPQGGMFMSRVCIYSSVPANGCFGCTQHPPHPWGTGSFQQGWGEL